MAVGSLFAPTCAHIGCISKTHYHSKNKKKDGTYSFNWKRFCEKHRTDGKPVIDDWKMQQGCANAGGKMYGFPCTSTITHPAQIDVHHKDGNNKNNDPANLECLCRNCHARVTIENRDHLNKRPNVTVLNPDLFELIT